MAGASTLLVLAEQAHRAQTREAALWYAVMTHLSLVAILGRLRRPRGQTGGTASLRSAGADPGRQRAPRFGLLALGFGAKAGSCPLHVGSACAPRGTEPRLGG